MQDSEDGYCHPLWVILATHRLATIEECADTLVAYCRVMNESGKVPSFGAAHTAILALKGSTNG